MWEMLIHRRRMLSDNSYASVPVSIPQTTLAEPVPAPCLVKLEKHLLSVAQIHLP